MSATPSRTPRYLWEDFAAGSVREFGAMPVTREAVLSMEGWGMYRMKKGRAVKPRRGP